MPDGRNGGRSVCSFQGLRRLPTSVPPSVRHYRAASSFIAIGGDDRVLTGQQNSMALPNSPGIGAIVAALPLFVMMFLLGVKRTPAWVAALAGLGAAMMVARLAYGMPV